MVVDTVIILLLTAIAVITGVILWRAASAKAYDPNHVDLSNGFDPKHDHFSKAHAQKVQQAEAQSRSRHPRAAAARTAEPEIHTASGSLSHLRPPKEMAAEQEQEIDDDRREKDDRRLDADRRNAERRNRMQRRAEPA